MHHSRRPRVGGRLCGARTAQHNTPCQVDGAAWQVGSKLQQHAVLPPLSSQLAPSCWPVMQRLRHCTRNRGRPSRRLFREQMHMNRWHTPPLLWRQPQYPRQRCDPNHGIQPRTLTQIASRHTYLLGGVASTVRTSAPMTSAGASVGTSFSPTNLHARDGRNPSG